MAQEMEIGLNLKGYQPLNLKVSCVQPTFIRITKYKYWKPSKVIVLQLFKAGKDHTGFRQTEENEWSHRDV